MPKEVCAWCRRVVDAVISVLREKRVQDCPKCRELFSEHEDDNKLARLLEDQHPQCGCEKFSVGQSSPGPVDNSEALHRLIISPRDYDPKQGMMARPFEKVFANGLSVWRAMGPEKDIRTLMIEGLSRKSSDPGKEVFAVCEARAGDVRGMANASEERLFCIYDQTVSRAGDPSLPAIATHAGVFLRAFPPDGTPNRKKILKDYAGHLYEKFLAGQIAAVDYRNGLCTDLNERARSGEFDRD